MNGKRTIGSAGTLRVPSRRASVRRWDGVSRTYSDWDGLRRDDELWFSDGDCFVHLYARGNSKRGPSFRVPYAVLKDESCDPMLDACCCQSSAQTPYSASATSAEGYFSAPTTADRRELFIPAPEDSVREEAFSWHLTTRNFFAFLFGRPLVGSYLGKSLVALHERLSLFRAGNPHNYDDFIAYLEEMGYLDFAHCPDYALAALYYAEHYGLHELWADAFAHCVGMNDDLSASKEFEPISRITKALITRAYLEMDLHLGRVTRAMSNFLEEDLSATYLGISSGARAHLDRFRSFLHSYYVEKFGYWPPPKGSQFSKALYRSMYFDFRNLYDFLVDNDSSDSLSAQLPASGGICVLQNVQAFDKRHKHPHLPHPLPLVPRPSQDDQRTQSQRGILSFKLETKQAKTERILSARAALAAATNKGDATATASPLVREYMRFEREWGGRQEEKVSIVDARRVRWILIYGVLQMLISATRAPKEVRDTEKPTYPLCCLVTGTPPWNAGSKLLVTSTNSPSNLSRFGSSSTSATPLLSPSLQTLLPAASPMSIHPDCETDDYFNNRHASSIPPQRQLSIKMPAPVRPADREGSAVSLLRNASTRSKRLSFSPFGSRRNSIIVKPSTPAFCEILVHGYGNGLNEATVDPPSSTPTINEQTRSESEDEPLELQTSVTGTPPSIASEEPAKRRRRPGKLTVQFAPIPQLDRTPILESFQIDSMHATLSEMESLSLDNADDSDVAALSPVWSSGASASSSDNISDLSGTDQASGWSSRSNSTRRSENSTPVSSIEGGSRNSTIWIVGSPERSKGQEAWGVTSRSSVERQSEESVRGVEVRDLQIDFYAALKMLPAKMTDLLDADAPALVSKPRVEEIITELEKGKGEVRGKEKGKKRRSVRAVKDMDIFAALSMGSVVEGA